MYNYNYNLRQQEQICIAVKSISLPVTTLEPEDWAPLTDIFSADALLSSPIMGEVNWPRNPDLISLSWGKGRLESPVEHQKGHI